MKLKKSMKMIKKKIEKHLIKLTLFLFNSINKYFFKKFVFLKSYFFSNSFFLKIISQKKF